MSDKCVACGEAAEGKPLYKKLGSNDCKVDVYTALHEMQLLSLPELEKNNRYICWDCDDIISEEYGTFVANEAKKRAMEAKRKQQDEARNNKLKKKLKQAFKKAHKDALRAKGVLPAVSDYKKKETQRKENKLFASFCLLCKCSFECSSGAYQRFNLLKMVSDDCDISDVLKAFGFVTDLTIEEKRKRFICSQCFTKLRRNYKTMNKRQLNSTIQASSNGLMQLNGESEIFAKPRPTPGEHAAEIAKLIPPSIANMYKVVTEEAEPKEVQKKKKSIGHSKVRTASPKKKRVMKKTVPKSFSSGSDTSTNSDDSDFEETKNKLKQKQTNTKKKYQKPTLPPLKIKKIGGHSGVVSSSPKTSTIRTILPKGANEMGLIEDDVSAPFSMSSQDDSIVDFGICNVCGLGYNSRPKDFWSSLNNKIPSVSNVTIEGALKILETDLADVSESVRDKGLVCRPCFSRICKGFKSQIVRRNNNKSAKTVGNPKVVNESKDESFKKSLKLDKKNGHLSSTSKKSRPDKSHLSPTKTDDTQITSETVPKITNILPNPQNPTSDELPKENIEGSNASTVNWNKNLKFKLRSQQSAVSKTMKEDVQLINLINKSRHLRYKGKVVLLNSFSVDLADLAGILSESTFRNFSVPLEFHKKLYQFSNFHRNLKNQPLWQQCVICQKGGMGIRKTTYWLEDPVDPPNLMVPHRWAQLSLGKPTDSKLNLATQDGKVCKGCHQIIKEKFSTYILEKIASSHGKEKEKIALSKYKVSFDPTGMNIVADPLVGPPQETDAYESADQMDSDISLQEADHDLFISAGEKADEQCQDTSNQQEGVNENKSKTEDEKISSSTENKKDLCHDEAEEVPSDPGNKKDVCHDKAEDLGGPENKDLCHKSETDLPSGNENKKILCSNTNESAPNDNVNMRDLNPGVVEEHPLDNDSFKNKNGAILNETQNNDVKDNSKDDDYVDHVTQDLEISDSDSDDECDQERKDAPSSSIAHDSSERLGEVKAPNVGKNKSIPTEEPDQENLQKNKDDEVATENNVTDQTLTETAKSMCCEENSESAQQPECNAATAKEIPDAVEKVDRESSSVRFDESSCQPTIGESKEAEESNSTISKSEKSCNANSNDLKQSTLSSPIVSSKGDEELIYSKRKLSDSEESPSPVKRFKVYNVETEDSSASQVSEQNDSEIERKLSSSDDIKNTNIWPPEDLNSSRGNAESEKHSEGSLDNVNTNKISVDYDKSSPNSYDKNELHSQSALHNPISERSQNFDRNEENTTDITLESEFKENAVNCDSRDTSNSESSGKFKIKSKSSEENVAIGNSENVTEPSTDKIQEEKECDVVLESPMETSKSKTSENIEPEKNSVKSSLNLDKEIVLNSKELVDEVDSPLVTVKIPIDLSHAEMDYLKSNKVTTNLDHSGHQEQNRRPSNTSLSSEEDDDNSNAKDYCIDKGPIPSNSPSLRTVSELKNIPKLHTCTEDIEDKNNPQNISEGALASDLKVGEPMNTQEKSKVNKIDREMSTHNENNEEISNDETEINEEVDETGAKEASVVETPNSAPLNEETTVQDVSRKRKLSDETERERAKSPSQFLAIDFMSGLPDDEPELGEDAVAPFAQRKKCKGKPPQSVPSAEVSESQLMEDCLDEVWQALQSVSLDDLVSGDIDQPLKLLHFNVGVLLALNDYRVHLGASLEDLAAWLEKLMPLEYRELGFETSTEKISSYLFSLSKPTDELNNSKILNQILPHDLFVIPKKTLNEEIKVDDQKSFVWDPMTPSSVPEKSKKWTDFLAPVNLDEVLDGKPCRLPWIDFNNGFIYALWRVNNLLNESPEHLIKMLSLTSTTKLKEKDYLAMAKAAFEIHRHLENYPEELCRLDAPILVRTSSAPSTNQKCTVSPKIESDNGVLNQPSTIDTVNEPADVVKRNSPPRPKEPLTIKHIPRSLDSGTLNPTKKTAAVLPRPISENSNKSINKNNVLPIRPRHFKPNVNSTEVSRATTSAEVQTSPLISSVTPRLFGNSQPSNVADLRSISPRQQISNPGRPSNVDLNPAIPSVPNMQMQLPIATCINPANSQQVSLLPVLTSSGVLSMIPLAMHVPMILPNNLESMVSSVQSSMNNNTPANINVCSGQPFMDRTLTNSFNMSSAGQLPQTTDTDIRKENSSSSSELSSKVTMLEQELLTIREQYSQVLEMNRKLITTKSNRDGPLTMLPQPISPPKGVWSESSDRTERESDYPVLVDDESDPLALDCNEDDDSDCVEVPHVPT